MQIPSYYEYFEERPVDGRPLPRRRGVAGYTDPELPLEAVGLHPTTYAWWKARALEGRQEVDPAEGIWGISLWRAERYYGDPTPLHVGRDAQPKDWPAGIDEVARRFRLHHYYRVWTSEECRDRLPAVGEVRAAFEVTEEWHDPPNGNVPDPHPDAPTLGAHAVPILGFHHRSDRFVFSTSWGEGWGYSGRGSISRYYFDRYLVEAWGRGGMGILPPVETRSGLVQLLWKSSVEGQEVHGREIVEAATGDRLAWTFAVKRGGYLDIEELFVWPTFRRQGHARRLVELLKELGQGVGLPFRAWVPFSDCEPANRSALVRTLTLLGLHLHPSPHRAAGFLARPESYQGVLPEPRIPPRAGSTRDRLRPESGTRLYTVWYGTNRRPVDPTDPAAGFTGERDDRVHYGKCGVTIPRSHRFGSVGSSWWRRWLRLTDDRLQIVSRAGQTEREFWEDIRAALGNCPETDRHALVFLHGYRTPFDRAAIRAAQIGFDLKVPGITAFFSWPSRGRTLQYPADGEAIQASEAAIAEFLLRFAQDSGADRVHLIAHSMGNRGLLRAVQRITARVEQQRQVRFGQIILAAPDVDPDVFRDLARLYPTLCERTTLYVSPHDRAVGWSVWTHGHPRVGLTPPVTVVEGIDTVEVPRLDLGNLRWHSYFAEAEGLLHDMFDLIRRNPDPADRQRLEGREMPDGKRYWVLS